ncbi:hypothetical protein [Olivibacter sitiensis]|uniref:hypothetical protein n=1 Tax=Olivibacter sitiensis TaxID=376470 RepID=UPI0012FB708F|nr:hypothetical protein [Olivibacter sitiensis]
MTRSIALEITEQVPLDITTLPLASNDSCNRPAGILLKVAVAVFAPTTVTPSAASDSAGNHSPAFTVGWLICHW